MFFFYYNYIVKLNIIFNKLGVRRHTLKNSKKEMPPKQRNKPRTSKELKNIEKREDPNTRFKIGFTINPPSNNTLKSLISVFFESKIKDPIILSNEEFGTLFNLVNETSDMCKDSKEKTGAEKIRFENIKRRLTDNADLIKKRNIVNTFTYDVKVFSYLLTLLEDGGVKKVGSPEETKKYSYGVLFFLLQLKTVLPLIRGKNYSYTSQIINVSTLLIEFVDKIYNIYLTSIGGVYATSDILKYAMLINVSPHLKYLPENISLNKLQRNVLETLDLKSNEQDIAVSAGTGSGKTVAMLFVLLEMLNYILRTQSTNKIVFTTSSNTSILPLLELFDGVIPFAIVEKQPNGCFTLKGNSLYVGGYNTTTKVGKPFVIYCPSSILYEYLGTLDVKYYLVADEAGESIPEFRKPFDCTHLIRFGIGSFEGSLVISQQNTQPFIALFDADGKRILPVPSSTLTYEELKQCEHAYRGMDPGIIQPLIIRARIQPSVKLAGMLSSLTENPLLYVDGNFAKNLYKEFLEHFRTVAPPELKLNPFRNDETKVMLHVSNDPLRELKEQEISFSTEFNGTEYKSYEHIQRIFRNDKIQREEEIENALANVKSNAKRDELIQAFQSKYVSKSFKRTPFSEISYLLDVFDGIEFLLYLYLKNIAVFYEGMPISYFDYIYSKLESGTIKRLYVTPQYTSGYNYRDLSLIVNTVHLSKNQVLQCIGRIGRTGLSTSGEIVDREGSIIRTLL